MAYVTTTHPDAATGEVRDMYARQQQSWGFVPNYAKLFSHRPELMGLWANMLHGIRSHVDPRRFELVTLAAARALRSSYCSLAHGKTLTAYFSPEEIQAMFEEGSVSSSSDSPLSAAEQAMMTYAARVATSASRVTAGEIDGLREHGFSDTEIFDIATVATARAFFAQLVEGLGAEADSCFLDLDERFRESLSVGRPIGFRATETLPAMEEEPEEMPQPHAAVAIPISASARG